MSHWQLQLLPLLPLLGVPQQLAFSRGSQHVSWWVCEQQVAVGVGVGVSVFGINGSMVVWRG